MNTEAVMSQQDLQQRAVDFARRVPNLNRFMISDKVTAELYGHVHFVLDARKLRSFYVRNEPVAELRNWDVFLAEVESRIPVNH